MSTAASPIVIPLPISRGKTLKRETSFLHYHERFPEIFNEIFVRGYPVQDEYTESFGVIPKIARFENAVCKIDLYDADYVKKLFTKGTLFEVVEIDMDAGKIAFFEYKTDTIPVHYINFRFILSTPSREIGL